MRGHMDARVGSRSLPELGAPAAGRSPYASSSGTHAVHGRVRAHAERRRSKARASGGSHRPGPPRSLDPVAHGEGADVSWTATSPLFASPLPAPALDVTSSSRRAESRMRRTPSAFGGSRDGSRRSSSSRSRRMQPGVDGRPETSPLRPQSRGSLVQLDGSYLFFQDGGRSAATSLANEWKRPSTTRGASYAQLASMLHLSGFHEQVGELKDAIQDHGVVTNLDTHDSDSDWSDDDESSLMSSRPSSVLGPAGARLDSVSPAPFSDEGEGEGEVVAATRIQARYRGNIDRQAVQQRHSEPPTQAEPPAAPLATIQSQLHELFTGIDVDGNGTLSREELASKLRADTELQQLLEGAGKASHYVFEQLDSDGDGAITAEEFVQLCVPDGDEDGEEGEEAEAFASDVGEGEGEVVAATHIQARYRGNIDRQAQSARPHVEGYIVEVSEQFIDDLCTSAIAACLNTDFEIRVETPAPAPTPNTDVAASKAKTRGALLGGLKSGALEAAVAKMEEDTAAEEVADAAAAQEPPPNPIDASFSSKYIRSLCGAAIAACASGLPVVDGDADKADDADDTDVLPKAKSVTFTDPARDEEIKSDGKTTDLVLPEAPGDGSQIQMLEQDEQAPGKSERTPGGSVDLDALLDRVTSAVAGGEEKKQQQESSEVALGVTPGAEKRREQRFAQRMVEQDLPFAKAEAFAHAAVAHEEALERAPKWTGVADDSDQLVLRPLQMPANMALVADEPAPASPAQRSGRSLWKKLRAKNVKKVEPESGLHLQLFSSLVPPDDPLSAEEHRTAFITLDLLGVSPLIGKVDTGSVCCKIRTIDSRVLQEEGGSAGPVPAVALSAWGPMLKPNQNEALLVVEDIDSKNLELRVCTSDSDHATELGRIWMPVANLLGSSAEGQLVDVWLPALSPPPQLDVSIKAVTRPRDDRSSGEDLVDFVIVLHSGDNIHVDGRISDVYVTAQLAAAGSTVIDEVLLMTAIGKQTAHPRFEEQMQISQEQLAAILAKRRDGTKLNLRFVVYSQNSLSSQPDEVVCEFEWEDVHALPLDFNERRRLEPRASESEFQRIVSSVAKSQRAWREQVVDRIDAVSAFRAIDTNGNGLLDSEELVRVAYVMDGGTPLTRKEVQAAEAEIAAGTYAYCLLPTAPTHISIMSI